jgi:hypothetical protein
VDNSGSTVVCGNDSDPVASASDSAEYSVFRVLLDWTVKNGVAMISGGCYGWPSTLY